MTVSPLPVASSLARSELDKAQDEKLLESALEDQKSARKAFLRDLKLALLMITAFQLLILPRFIQLSDEMQAKSRELTAMRTQEIVARELQTALESLQSVLKRGASLLSKQLTDMPGQLHQQTTRLDNEIQDWREAQMPGALPRRQPQNPRAQTTQAGETDFLSALSAEEKRKALATDPTLFHSAISPVVRAKIIQPAFASLNSQLFSELQQPYALAGQRVERVLKERSNELAGAGVDSNRIRQQLDAEEARLREMRFVVPDSDFWWASVGNKNAFAGEQNVSSRKVTGEIERQLSRLATENAATESRLVAAIHDTESSQQHLQAAMKELGDRLRTIQDTLADEEKPFKLVTVQLRDAVLYFPVGIALASAYLTFEYMVLATRVRRLRNAYHRLGYGAAALRLYFAAVPGTTTVSASIVALIFSVPLIMCFWSVHRIHSSTVLANTGPSALYVLAEIIICGCFLSVLFAATSLALHFRPERS